MASWFKRKISGWIKKRLSGYKIDFVAGGKGKGLKGNSSQKVLVIGSGLAGIAAACALAERGFEVEIAEKNEYPGGKTGAWQHTFENGYQTWIDHGFHAFFYQYYNLNEFLKKIGADAYLAPIADYLILTQTGERLGFDKVEKTPLLNIYSLSKNGFFKITDMMRRESQEMGELLKYHPQKTFEQYDHQSFQDFCDRLQLPKNLQLIFNSFSRAFFAEPDQMSMAELMKSFHFFYLSHDFGINYDYFTADYETAFLKPLRAHFKKLGIQLNLNTAIDSIESAPGNRLSINQKTYDYAVLATDVLGTQKIVKNSPWLAEAQPNLVQQLESLRHANGYAVYKIWIKGKIKESYPVFFITDRYEVLDSVTQFHLFEPAAKKWADENQGLVLELHCYSVKPEWYDESSIKQQFKTELQTYLPELGEFEIVHEYLQLKQNFTSFSMGKHADRPAHDSSKIPLKIAGDWVKLPIPAMLMEGAYCSGLFAANEILKEESLPPTRIQSVPNYGLMAKK